MFPDSTRILILVLLLFGPTTGAATESGNRTVEGFADVYERAVQADPRLRAQGFEVEGLREDRRHQLGSLLPSVSLNASVTRTRRDQLSSGLGGDEEIERLFTREQYGVEIRQALLDLPAWYGLQRRDVDIRKGEAELEAERQELMLRVAEAYLDVLSAQSALALSRREVAAIEVSFDHTEALYQEGMAAVTDLEEIRALRDSARAGVIRAEGELQIAREQLSRITGHRHGLLAPLRDAVEIPQLKDRDAPDWISSAIEQSPRLRAMNRELEGFSYEAQAARSQRYPTVQIVAGYNRLDDLDGTQFGRELEDATIGLEMRLPLYQGGSIGAQGRGLERRRDRARETLEETRREVRAEVWSAYQALRAGTREIRALEQAVRSGERSVEAVRAGMQEGTRSAVDLAEAQKDLFVTRRDLAEARYRGLLSGLILQVRSGQAGPGHLLELDAMFGGVPELDP